MFETNAHPAAFFDSKGLLLDWQSAKPMPKGWTGFARRNDTLFFVGKDGDETSYTALQAKTVADAMRELSGRLILVFNGLRFLEHACKADPTASRAHGLYRRSPSGIHLYRLDGTLEAYLVTSRERGYFAVTASAHASGEVRYMHSTTSLTERWLDLCGKGHSDEHDLVRGIQFDVAHLQAKVA